MGGIYDGPPVQSAFPYAVVELGPEADWSHKSGLGREVRLSVTIRDGGERPARLHLLMSEAESAMEAMAEIDGWSVATLRFLRSRVVREARGSWAGILEYRARMLAAAPEE
jgi:hypothetical protein